jgi:hypothetical protein
MTGYGFPVTIRRELSGAVSAWRSVTPPTALAKGGLAALGSGAEVGGGGLHFTVAILAQVSRPLAWVPCWRWRTIVYQAVSLISTSRSLLKR